MVNYWKDWPEIIGFILLIIGFVVALGAGSAVLAYIFVLLAGFMGGRIWFAVKEDFKIPWFIILLGFLIGFIIGNRVRGGYGDIRIIVFFYVFGIVVSYYLHDKGIIKSLSY